MLVFFCIYYILRLLKFSGFIFSYFHSNYALFYNAATLTDTAHTLHTDRNIENIVAKQLDAACWNSIFFFWWKWQEKDSDINSFQTFFNLTAAVKREDDRHNERKSQRRLKKRRSGHKEKNYERNSRRREEKICINGWKSFRN